jgi:DNA-binding IclR family transcriptional regulator
VDEATRQAALKQLKKRDPENFPRVLSDLTRAMQEFAQLGMVFNLGQSHSDIHAIGVPVVSLDGKKVMALTSGGAKSSVTREKLLNEVAPSLKELALRLSPMLH